MQKILHGAGKANNAKGTVIFLVKLKDATSIFAALTRASVKNRQRTRTGNMFALLIPAVFEHAQEFLPYVNNLVL